MIFSRCSTVGTFRHFLKHYGQTTHLLLGIGYRVACHLDERRPDGNFDFLVLAIADLMASARCLMPIFWSLTEGHSSGQARILLYIFQ